MRRLIASYFDGGLDRGDMYRRLARVLEHTAHTELEGWQILVEQITFKPDEYQSALGNISHAWNTTKLRQWIDRALETSDGDEVLLIDGDCAIIKPLNPIWCQRFDIAYTVRPHGLPLNGGVVFLRMSRRVRGFLKSWWAKNLEFLNNADTHAPWRAKYAGINQSSFGFIIERVNHGCHLIKLPCEEWNACAPSLFDPRRTRVIHIKSALRRALFGIQNTIRSRSMIPLIDLWNTLERRVPKGSK
jgi:hypothetical protein